MYDNISSSAWCGLYDDSYPGQPGKTLDDAWDIIRPILPDGTTDENCALIILMNVSHYNGTVNYYSQSKRTTGFVCLSPGAPGTMQGFENVFVHEVGGHAIGHLADCYTRASTITSAKVQQTLQYQSLGWYLNVTLPVKKRPAHGVSSSGPRNTMLITAQWACLKELVRTTKGYGDPNPSFA